MSHVESTVFFPQWTQTPREPEIGGTVWLLPRNGDVLEIWPKTDRRCRCSLTVKETQGNSWVKRQVAENVPSGGTASGSLEAPSG